MENHEENIPKDNDVADDKVSSDDTDVDGMEPELNVESFGAEIVEDTPIIFNAAYEIQTLVDQLKIFWNDDSRNNFTDPETAVEVTKDPFRLCVLPELLQDKAACSALAEEMSHKVIFKRKISKLYYCQFYRSDEIFFMRGCKLLKNFCLMLQQTVRPWLEHLTGIKLTCVSAQCSMYTVGDYYLVDNAKLEDQKIGFVYFVSPFDNMENWSESQGGCLEIFGRDVHWFPQFPVKRKISPKNNQFVFFKSDMSSLYQVSEVTTFDYPRLTINGWFHGPAKQTLQHGGPSPLSAPEMDLPRITTELRCKKLLNENYFVPSICKFVKKELEEGSEFRFVKFIRPEICEAALKQLLTDDSLRWRAKHSAIEQMEVLHNNSARGIVAELIQLFLSSIMFEAVDKYSDLDLRVRMGNTPSAELQVQRWTNGSYSMFGNLATCSKESVHLLYYLNASSNVGIIKYYFERSELKPQSAENYDEFQQKYADEEQILIPSDNALDIFYCKRFTKRVTKYISKLTRMEEGPLFVFVCSYIE